MTVRNSSRAVRWWFVSPRLNLKFRQKLVSTVGLVKKLIRWWRRKSRTDRRTVPCRPSVIFLTGLSN